MTIEYGYNDNLTQMYSDTDSLICQKKQGNWYKDISSNISHFNTSDYSGDSVYTSD